MADPSSPITWAAVLTGDVVASSRLPRQIRSRLTDLLEHAAKQVQVHYADVIPLPVDVFRGDSWQLIVVPPSRAFRVALSFRAILRHESGRARLDTRIGIGIGTVDFVPSDRISHGDGEAFRLSGAALERLGRRGRRMAVSIPAEQRSDATEALGVIFGLVDALSKRWTGKQAFAVWGALRGRTQEEIGLGWKPSPITQQAVAQHLDGAGWNAIDESIEYFENVVDRMNASGTIRPADLTHQ